MQIVGAGLAGLLAANMLAHRHPVVYEAQSSLPNNHSAVLRFRTSQIGDITRIPFRKVTMIKSTVPHLNPVADALAYSFKNSGIYQSDRSINQGTVVEDRYIAPPNLIERMANNVDIQFKTAVEKFEGPLISTIPMPRLMEALNYPGPRPSFTYSSGVNFSARIRECDAYVSLLVPDPKHPFSRISITGNELIVECYQIANNTRAVVADAVNLLGLPHSALYDLSRHEQRYAKINPVDDDLRKAFMFWATDQHGVFSLGRFATWRPHLLLDDLVKDIRLIDGWTDRRYSITHHR